MKEKSEAEKLIDNKSYFFCQKCQKWCEKSEFSGEIRRERFATGDNLFGYVSAFADLITGGVSKLSSQKVCTDCFRRFRYRQWIFIGLGVGIFLLAIFLEYVES